MDALSLTPLGTASAEPSAPSFRWSEKASKLWVAIQERFRTFSELSTEGPAWPIAITVGAFLLLLVGIYITGWHHIAAGP